MGEHGRKRNQSAHAPRKSIFANAARSFTGKDGGGQPAAHALGDVVAGPGANGGLFDLLEATSTRAAPFRGRQDELGWLKRWWADPSQLIAVVTGQPGTGKSRLVAQFALGIPGPATAGWFRGTATETVATLRNGRTPALILVDDADARPDLAELVAALLAEGSAGGKTAVRALMTGPDPALWPAWPGGAAELRLGAFGERADRARWFGEALAAYATARGTSRRQVPDPLGGHVTDPAAPALWLHVQALLAVVKPEVMPAAGNRWDGLPFGQAAGELLAEELARWRVTGREPGPRASDLADNVRSQALAVLLLSGPAGPDRAAETLRRVPALADAPSERLEGIAAWAARLYPGGPGRLVELRPRSVSD